MSLSLVYCSVTSTSYTMKLSTFSNCNHTVSEIHCCLTTPKLAESMIHHLKFTGMWGHDFSSSCTELFGNKRPACVPADADPRQQSARLVVIHYTRVFNESNFSIVRSAKSKLAVSAARVQLRLAR
jgi:hypothetical protein